jgi:uncharacterized damage-inducible protein DinB
MSGLVAHFQMMARYNRRANAILLKVCARLSDAALRKKRRAFFDSIHGTLNHILVGDRIWLARFAGRDVPSTGLDAILYEDFDQLVDARRSEDAGIEEFIEGLDDDVLMGEINYVNNTGIACQDPLSLLIAHLFNHQTHHRGQIHDMLSQTEVAPPSLDMHRIIRPSSVKSP